MPALRSLSKFILLPEITLKRVERQSPAVFVLHCEKKPHQEYCPHCAHGKFWLHEYREVLIKDQPVRGKTVWLKIRKRRLKCCACKRTFHEPVPGILPRKRATHRFSRGLLWACENYADLKKVKKEYRCSNQFLYNSLYKTLELNRKRHLNYAWPKTIGIDEHSFAKCRKTGRTKFSTMIVDFINKRPYELVEGKSGADLFEALSEKKGRENVTHVALDLCDPYKKFIKEFFPNAKMVADKFHVLRLLNTDLLRHRKQITGTRADWQARRLLTMSAKKLNYWQRKTLYDYLQQFPSLNELYHAKETLHGFYRIRGYKRACSALTKMLDHFANSPLKEIQRLRRTLKKWKEEILNYFRTGITNARTEGFNHVAKLVKRKAFGYKNFNNYRLRVLNASFS